MSVSIKRMLYNLNTCAQAKQDFDRASSREERQVTVQLLFSQLRDPPKLRIVHLSHTDTVWYYHSVWYYGTHSHSVTVLSR